MIAFTPDSEHRAFKIQNLNEMSMFCIKHQSRECKLYSTLDKQFRTPAVTNVVFALGKEQLPVRMEKSKQ